MNNQTLAEIALEKIKQDILLGKFTAGSRLNIEDLKRRYDIGLTPIREALNRLVSIGFVEFIGLKGFKVTQLSKENLVDIYAARQLIEIKALRLALNKGDDQWEAEVLACYYRLAKLEKDKKFSLQADIVEWMQRYQAFHFAILNACQSEWLLKLDKILFEQSERYRYLRLISADNVTKLFVKKDKLHHQLVDSLCSRDKLKVVELFSKQLSDTVEDLLKNFDFNNT